jgi:outer membrane protein assembly factor BamB
VTPNLIVIPTCKKGGNVGLDPLKAQGLIMPGNVAEKWRHDTDTTDVPSPILVGDLVFIMNDKGTLFCYDAATGKRQYRETITNMRHRANPVYADDKLYLLGRDSTMVVVKPGREFDKLATNKLPDTFSASPAIANGVIYLRGWKNLYAIGTK